MQWEEPSLRSPIRSPEMRDVFIIVVASIKLVKPTHCCQKYITSIQPWMVIPFRTQLMTVKNCQLNRCLKCMDHHLLWVYYSFSSQAPIRNWKTTTWSNKILESSRPHRLAPDWASPFLFFLSIGNNYAIYRSYIYARSTAHIFRSVKTHRGKKMTLRYFITLECAYLRTPKQPLLSFTKHLIKVLEL